MADAAHIFTTVFAVDATHHIVTDIAEHHTGLWEVEGSHLNLSLLPILTVWHRGSQYATRRAYVHPYGVMRRGLNLNYSSCIMYHTRCAVIPCSVNMVTFSALSS